MVWLPVPAGPPPAPKRPRWWVAVAVIVWSVVLVGGLLWAFGHGSPTDRTQTTVADALPVVDRASAELVRATTSDGLAVAAISGLEKVGKCSVTPFRSGERYGRFVSAVVTPGSEQALLTRVRARLPANYHATVRGGARPHLTADAGFWVAVNGVIDSPGVVQFTVDTGSCRVPGNLPAAAPDDPTDAQRAPLSPVLTDLGETGQQWHWYAASCPGGGQLSTVTAVVPKPARPLNTELGAVDGRVAVARADLYGYTVGGTGIAARLIGDAVVLTATTPCP